ncbi:DUF1648 domain-containing protein [Microbacterium sp. zg.Y909]|uniref:DUF1648 domain-containing protein n=1 Tax=Microbacterium sp. zg.Y909 TaxID=2969413 RepID=UPI00214CF7C6|nr:DUF1648 domain-containing protein [Microbacterium sp. zg.Y909]MCR2825677.1 DUF1648 domain-containing protein [Microbacterium sp. zg.Y909]
MTRRPADPNRRFLIVALIAPITIALAASVVQLIMLPNLAATVAIHWDFSGTPDGFGPAWSFPALTAGLGIGLSALLAGTALASDRAAARRDARPATPTANSGFVGALVLGTVAFLSVLATALAAVQVGAPDEQAVGAGLPMLGALAAGVAAGLAGWWALPRATAAPVAGEAAHALDLGADESAVWVRTATMSRLPLALLGGAALVTVGLGVVLLVTGDDAAGWITLASGVVVTLLVATGTAYRVVVDNRGLTVRAFAGVPRWRLEPSGIRAVEVVFVNPTGDFGGWGWRWTPGRFGVVTRAGEAIQVTRADGRQFVVTVDDAETGAAVLQAVADRARQEGPRT